jgi:hypothetical membrane protein
MTCSSRGALAWLSAGVTYLTLEAVAARAFLPSYSYTHNYISDLGVKAHSPLASVMNTAFVVQGMLFLVGAVLTRRAAAFLTLAGANAVGNMLIALCHSGSSTHVVGAVLAIVGGNAAILAGSSIIGGWHRRMSLALGAIGLTSFAVFAVAVQTSGVGSIGVWERGSVYSITAWELLTGGWLLSRRPTPWPCRARRV